MNNKESHRVKLKGISQTQQADQMIEKKKKEARCNGLWWIAHVLHDIFEGRTI